MSVEHTAASIVNILYVEDDPLTADLTRRSLREHVPDYRLETVVSQAEALRRIMSVREPAYDLVLTDLRLPDGDGISLLARIREAVLPLAVVVITGGGDEDTAVAALKAGADDYVVKRSDYLDRLPITLEAALHRRHAEIARHAHRLNVLYAERNADDIDITVRHLARHTPYIRLDVVGTGIEAWARLADNPHRLKYDVLLLDYRLPGLDALELLKALQDAGVRLPVILVTGQGDEELVVQALRLGATSYVIKSPGYVHRLPVEIENAYHRARLDREQAALRESESRYRDAARAAALMAERLTAAQEEERARIASDLHDDLSQRAATLTLNLGVLKDVQAGMSPAVLREIDLLEKQARAIADGIRRVSHELHPGVLKHIGLVAALRLFSSGMTGPNVEVDVPDEEIPLTPAAELCIYRVVQEALHNAARHSGARKVSVRLVRSRDSVILSVIDDGNGFDADAVRRRSGLGLVSMEARVRLVGGSLEIVTEPGSGTTIKAIVPLDAVAATADVRIASQMVTL